MAGKRKRSHKKGPQADGPMKRQKPLQNEYEQSKPSRVNQPLLLLYYAKVTTLREYILSKLPLSSKSRRKRILSVPRWIRDEAGDFGTLPMERQEALALDSTEQHALRELDERRLGKLLDTTLVGQLPPRHSSRAPDSGFILRDFRTFSQRSGGSSLSDSTLGRQKGATRQTELVDSVIWHLFYRKYVNVQKPPHMLCHGYQVSRAHKSTAEDQAIGKGVFGLDCLFPNSLVAAIKEPIWQAVLDLIGERGDVIMLELIRDCGLFVAVDSGWNNYYQVCGTPLTDLPAVSRSRLSNKATPKADAGVHVHAQGIRRVRSPASISFNRHRILYSRPPICRKSRATFGLGQKHALNIYNDAQNEEHTFRLLQYIFPRQFKLHNIFTLIVDTKDVNHQSKDYGSREQEFRIWDKKNEGRNSVRLLSNLPKRLKGECVKLIQKLQKRHSRCSYLELLRHYCPGPPPVGGSESRQQAPLVDAATPSQSVSAFCRAVLSKILPNDFFGEGESGEHNRKVLMYNVHLFVSQNRYENMNLHAVYQGIKIAHIPWLTPENVDASCKMAKSDLDKRRELFLELLYYIFDSLLISLLRTNFHITESSTHKNRLFFFRHDVWSKLMKPSLNRIKDSMFEALPPVRVKKVLDSRRLGHSQLRLVPKGESVRPIMNLRRKCVHVSKGKRILGQAINSTLKPIYSMLQYEKSRQPGLLGSSLFSAGDIYPKLKAFQRQLRCNTNKLFFVKVDVQSCFDSIPQRRVVQVIEQLCSEREYNMTRHAEMRSCELQGYRPGLASAKASRRFVSRAVPVYAHDTFKEVTETTLASRKRGTVFIDSVTSKYEERDDLLHLLEDHIERNIVRIGRKYFRQKNGIPQGSILSSMLCSFFYSEFEREHLAFLREGESLLLRLIDDFLLITMSKQQALRFLQTMDNGNEEYGIKVRMEKTLVNFQCSVNGARPKTVEPGLPFPYCGASIDTTTLELTKDRERRIDGDLSNSLTVESYKTPGQTFHQKTLNAFKIQMHVMYTDTSFNSPATVLSTLYLNIVETAMKMHRYVKSFRHGQVLDSKLMTRTVGDLITLAVVLAKGRHKGSAAEGYECAIRRGQVRWLAATAFKHVLGSKPSRYGAILAWTADLLREESRRLGGSELQRLRGVASKADEVFRGYRF